MKKIVIVDDEIEICNLFSKMLEKKYDVTTFTNFEDSINYIRKTKVDLLISDYFIPGKLSLLIAIKEILNVNKNIKIIVMSGDIDIERYNDVSFADDVIYKPISIESLLKKVNDALEG